MQFGINWNDGYEVCALMEDEWGLRRWLPLRNFGHRQGDARIFKEEDCPDLTEFQLRMLTKRYDSSVKYKRTNGRHFVKINNN